MLFRNRFFLVVFLFFCIFGAPSVQNACKDSVKIVDKERSLGKIKIVSMMFFP
jgi:cell division protein FtsB